MRTANTTWFSWMLWQVDEGIWCSSLAQRRSWQEATHAVANTDLVETLAKMFGAEYDKYFVELLKPVLRFAKPGRSSSDKAMAVGIIGEVSIHPGAPPLTACNTSPQPRMLAGVKAHGWQGHDQVPTPCHALCVRGTAHQQGAAKCLLLCWCPLERGWSRCRDTLPCRDPQGS